MKFSTRDRYALRLMVELANHPNDLIPHQLKISGADRHPAGKIRPCFQRARRTGRLPSGPSGCGDHLR